jgi:hypothetical protein
LAALEGIVAFFGESGTGDSLNVHGIASPTSANTTSPHQITAIGITGLGSGTNRLVATHNDLFGAGYTIDGVENVTSVLAASDLSRDKIDVFARELASPAREIDSFIAASLSTATRRVLFGVAPNETVVYRVNAPGAAPFANLIDGQAYVVSSVDDTTISLTPVGNGSASQVAIPRAAVGDTATVRLEPVDATNATVIQVSPTASFAGNQSLAQNRVEFASNHQLRTGQPVVYRRGLGNAPIGGLTEGRVYYVIKVSDTAIQLASESSPGTPITLASPSQGAPDHLASWTTASFNPQASVRDNQIHFGTSHNLATGESVVYHAGNVDASGSVQSVGGLTDNGAYYVVRVNATTIQLASSLANAINGIALPISALASPVANNDSLTSARSFSQGGIVNNRIVFASDPALADGQAIEYRRGQAARMWGWKMVASITSSGSMANHMRSSSLRAGAARCSRSLRRHPRTPQPTCLSPSRSSTRRRPM